MSVGRHQTVRDLLRAVLPLGTRVVAGGRGLNRPVAWTSVMRPHPPAFPTLGAHELALLSIDALHLLSDKLTLVDIVNDLVGMDAAAVAVVGAIDGRARAAAESHGLPLLALPKGTPLRLLSEAIIGLLTGPPPVPEVRGLDVREQLLQLSTENRGMGALTEALADATGKTALVQDKRLDPMAANGALTERADWPDVARALAREEGLPASFLDRLEVAQITPEPALIDMPEFSIKRLVVPIIANRMGRGYFSLLSDANGFDALDAQYARHGAAVCALEMAKEKAVREAQKRVQGSVLERLLNGTVPADQALRQLTRLGHKPEEKPYVALVARWERDGGPSERRLETMFNEAASALGLDALVQIAEGGVVVFCDAETEEKPVLNRVVPRPIRLLAETLQERASTQFPETGLAIGIGRSVRTLSDWRGGYQEALAAQRIALQWHSGMPLFFGDLGVYRLLSLLLETAELRSFYRETLGELAVERYTNDEFIKTLEAFFDEDGNLSKTAQRLNVHRNTLLYRMERIEQIGGFDMENPETRLAVHLALKIRRLLVNHAAAR